MTETEIDTGLLYVDHDCEARPVVARFLERVGSLRWPARSPRRGRWWRRRRLP